MIHIFCTGRGTHKRRDLYVLSEKDSEIYLAQRVFGPGVGGPGPRTARPRRIGYRDEHEGADYKGNHVLKCVACRRRPTVKSSTLQRLLDAGLTEVDISRLPF